MSPVIVIVPLPARKPNMSLAGLSAGLGPTSFFSSLRMRAFFEEEPAFFTAVIFPGLATLY